MELLSGLSRPRSLTHTLIPSITTCIYPEDIFGVYEVPEELPVWEPCRLLTPGPGNCYPAHFPRRDINDRNNY